MILGIDDIRRQTGELTEFDWAVMEENLNPSLGEYLGASAGQAFDRTSGVRGAEAVSLWNADREARAFGGKIFASEEEARESVYYREGVEVSPGMSEDRLKILAEHYDERRERERLLNAGDRNGPWWYKFAGFGAGMLGSLPDPINAIPFGGQAVTGTRLAEMTAKQVLARSSGRGLIEGAAGNFVSSAVAAWDLNKKGEDISAQEVLLDTMFGAVAGPVFGMAGGMLGRSVARRGIRADTSAALDALPEGEGQALRNTLAAMRQGDADAYRKAGELRDLTLSLRKNTLPAQRMEIARAMEKALADVSEGNAVDVGPILRDSALLGRMYDKVLADPLGGQPDEVLAVLRSPEFEQILLERGPAFFDKNGELVVRGRNIARMGHEASGFGLVKILWRHGEKSGKDSQFKITREDILRLPEILNEYLPEPTGKKHVGGRWSVEADNGKSLVVVVGKRRGNTEPTTITFFKTDDTSRYPHSSKRNALASPTRLATKGQSSGKDTAVGPFDRHRQGQGLSENRIDQPGAHVNGLDWRTETPEEYPPLPQEPGSGAEAAETQAGVSVEESIVSAEMAEGRIVPHPDDLEAYNVALAEKAKSEEMRETALSVVECVIGVER